MMSADCLTTVSPQMTLASVQPPGITAGFAARSHCRTPARSGERPPGKAWQPFRQRRGRKLVWRTEPTFERLCAARHHRHEEQRLASILSTL
jgi:hypothetical protein